jgi:predicted  nucleic acid-binding Zn-ribbon protein
MKSNVIAGINEKEVLQLRNAISNHVDNISEIFSKFDDDMDEVKKYYDSNSFKALCSSYESLKKNFNVIKENILIYSSDLGALIVKMKEGMLDLARLYETFKERYAAKRKAIEMNGGIKKWH